MSVLAKFLKDPAAVLDYTVDWLSDGWLVDDDTIAAATVTVTDDESDTPLVVDAVNFDDSTVTAWLSGGVVGTTYAVVFEVVTDQARTDQRTVSIKVQER